MFLERQRNESVYQELLKQGKNEILSDLLSRRIQTVEQIDSILSANLFNLPNPLLLPDMLKARETVLMAIEKEYKIACVVDYDTDGISSGAVLYEGLKSLGVKEKNIYILVTDRHADGYGFSKGTANKIVNGMCGFIPNLVITADLGSSDGQNIHYFLEQMNENYQTELGKDIFFIVTDHHHISETTPPENITAFVSPQRKDSVYPDKAICGAFVAWNLIAATNNLVVEKTSKVATSFDADSLFDYVSCATVGDMMDLKSPNNRSAIKKGIELFNNETRPAWAFMLSKVSRNGLDEETIGFQLSPRINALSRMGDNARVAFKFLTSKESWDISNYWDTMDSSNNVRKEEQKIATDIVIELAKETENLVKNGLVFFVPKAEHGVVGLCANELVKQHGKPSIVLSSKENGEIVGSGRSIAGIDIREILANLQDELGCFTKFGGHTMACGLSLKPEFLDIFKEKFNEYVSLAAMKNLKPVFKHDGFLNKELLDLFNFEKNIEQLKPFGQGFEKPSFLIQGSIKQETIKPLGQSGQHYKVQIESGDTTYECVWFKTNPDDWINEESLFLVELSKNSFRNIESIQIMISVQEEK